MCCWWFWRENNRNKTPLIPIPHFHPQFSYSLHHDHHRHISMVSSLLPPRNPPMHFYCFNTTNTIFLFFCLQRHCHQNNHISLLFPPPPPHYYCFPITITFLLFSPHRHCHHHISIVSQATLWRHTYKFSCWRYNHAWTCLYDVLILSVKTTEIQCWFWWRRENNGNVMWMVVVVVVVKKTIEMWCLWWWFWRENYWNVMLLF